MSNSANSITLYIHAIVYNNENGGVQIRLRHTTGPSDYYGASMTDVAAAVSSYLLTKLDEHLESGASAEDFQHTFLSRDEVARSENLALHYLGCFSITIRNDVALISFACGKWVHFMERKIKSTPMLRQASIACIKTPSNARYLSYQFPIKKVRSGHERITKLSTACLENNKTASAASDKSAAALLGLSLLKMVQPGHVISQTHFDRDDDPCGTIHIKATDRYIAITYKGVFWYYDNFCSLRTSGR